MITYYTTFSASTDSWYTFSRSVETWNYTGTTTFTSANTFSTSGTHIGTYTTTGTVTSQTTTSVSGTYTYTKNTSFDGSYSFTATYNTQTNTSESTTTHITEYELYETIYYTESCDIPYTIVTNSLSTTGIFPGTNSLKGIGTYFGYETITHNYPNPHTFYGENYRSFDYTSTSTIATTSATTQTYTTTTAGWTITQTTLTDTGYTTGTQTYTTTNSNGATGTFTETASEIGLDLETHREGVTRIGSIEALYFYSVDGFNTYVTYYGSKSDYYSYTLSNYFSFSNTFTYIGGTASGYSFQSIISRGSGSGSDVKYYTFQTTQTQSYWSSTSEYSYFTALTNAGSTSETDVRGFSSTTSFSFATFTNNNPPGSSTLTTYAGPTWYYSKTIYDSYLTDINYGTTTSKETSTIVTSLYVGTTGTTSSVGGTTSNTTRNSFLSKSVTTSSTQVTYPTFWYVNSFSTLTYTNSVAMSVGYVFERLKNERMFSVSSTNTSLIVFSNAVKETTKYIPVPVYTLGSSTSFESYTAISGTSYTTSSGSTKSAFKITNYSYDYGLVTISQSDGTVASPVGAFGQPKTSISYGSGIYDITSRTMSNTNVTTNTTERVTITDSLYSETIENGDINIHPRLAFRAETITSASIVLSLLGAIAFDTTSLANP